MNSFLRPLLYGAALVLATIPASARPVIKFGPLPTPTPKPRVAIKIDPATFNLIANSSLLNATTVDGFIDAIPDWTKINKAKPSGESQSDAGQSKEAKDGRNYTVVRTHYSITDTPEEIVTYQPVNGFWLGSLVQGKGLRLGLGSMQEIAIPSAKRAPFRVSTDLPMGANFRDIAAPSTSDVSSAIGALMQKGNSIQWGGARTLSIVDNYTEDQTAHELGLDARYMTASLKASLKADRYSNKHTITAAFIERAFTAQADFGGRSRREAFFNDNFTIDDAKALVNQERLTTNNLPTYIKSITYGRIVLFNLTSTLTESEMKTAVEASVNGGTWGVNAGYKGDAKSKATTFELRVTALGGPQNGFSKLVPANGISNALAVMNSYLQQSAPLTSMMPISYTANTLRDDQLAALAVTTDYTVTKYVGDPIGERYKIKMWVDVTKSDDGVADNTMECYGDLRVNGDKWWSIDRSEADTIKREKGQTIEISEDAAHRQKEFTAEYYYDTPTLFNIILTLRDADSGSADDTFGSYIRTIDLHTIVGQDKTFTFDSGDDEASRLHIKVERVDYL